MWIVSRMVWNGIVVLVVFLGAVMCGEKPLTIDCDYIYNETVSFPAQTLALLNISIPNSHNSSIRITSPCCEQIQPSDIGCGPCFEGEKVCFVNHSEAADLSTNIGEDCLNETEYSITCHARLCNGTFPPGYVTNCTSEKGVKYTCLNDGSWHGSVCQPAEYQQTTSMTYSPSMATYESTDSIHKTTGTRDQQFGWTGMSPGSAMGNFSKRGPLEITSEANNKLGNESSTVSPLDEEQIRKDLIHFLIALGVVMGAVFLLVCGFFVRKAKKKKIKEDYSLEYFQETEYIDSICGKGTCTINPDHNDVKGRGKPLQRYIKKENGPYFKRGSLRDRHGSATSYENNVDVPRRLKNDYTDKYVTTATGSNFYSYRTSPDVDLGDPGNEPSVVKPPLERRDVDKMTSFKPKCSKKHKARKPRPGTGVPSDDAKVQMSTTDEMYAVSYKNKLKSSLDDWSAEESDV